MSRDLFRPLVIFVAAQKKSVAAAHTFSAFVDDDCTGQFLLASRAAECQRRKAQSDFVFDTGPNVSLFSHDRRITTD